MQKEDEDAAEGREKCMSQTKKEGRKEGRGE